MIKNLDITKPRYGEHPFFSPVALRNMEVPLYKGISSKKCPSVVSRDVRFET